MCVETVFREAILNVIVMGIEAVGGFELLPYREVFF